MNEAKSDAKGEARAAEGAEHLQTAALEVISAMRAFLDVAEDVVTNDSRLDDLTRILGSVAQGVSNATGFPIPGTRSSDEAASPTGPPASGPPTPGSDPEASTGPEGSVDPEASTGPEGSEGPDVDLRPSGVQHIRVS